MMAEAKEYGVGVLQHLCEVRPLTGHFGPFAASRSNHGRVRCTQCLRVDLFQMHVAALWEPGSQSPAAQRMRQAPEAFGSLAVWQFGSLAVWQFGREVRQGKAGLRQEPPRVSANCVVRSGVEAVEAGTSDPACSFQFCRFLYIDPVSQRN